MNFKFQKMINYIENGVPLENGEIRNFDIIDYYFMTNLSYDELYEKIKKNLNLKQIRAFKQFCTNNSLVRVRELEDCGVLLYCKLTIGVQFDSKGNVIPGSGKSVTLDDNVRLLKFLHDNNIPLCAKAMDCAQRRFLAGTITVPEVEDIVSLKKRINL